MQIPGYIGWPVAALFGFGLLYFAAGRAAYYPLKYPAGFWGLQSELGAEDVWLLTSDRVRLHAWWISRPHTSLVTLYFHGNAGNVTHRFQQIREITGAGSSILVLDYRGYGKSEGHPTEKGIYRDADAAYQYLRDHRYGAPQIILQGESLGTAVAVDLASRRECAGVVLEAAFKSGRDSFDSDSKISKIRAPLLSLLHKSPVQFAESLAVPRFGATYADDSIEARRTEPTGSISKAFKPFQNRAESSRVRSNALILPCGKSKQSGNATGGTPLPTTRTWRT